MSALAAIERPNGKLYRPRKIDVLTLGEEDGEIWTVNVFGTHDKHFAELRAQAHLDDLNKTPGGCQYSITQAGEKTWLRPVPVGSYEGVLRRTYQEDPEKGRACVSFDVEVTEDWSTR